MYIKQIIIQGFKSYKDQTVIEPFSPKHNVVVGRNGSGKSNFFAAIRFVLSDAYNSLNREERQGLLHEGSGSAVMSAYVEIIFDNSDDRFPTGRDELILRRTIGLKKDEYSLDRKNSTKSEVMSLLESAGFSRSNPYYIVPQGRVTALTNMKDHERLLLLKEVAGTQVYEARRGESIRIMGETDSKRGKIDDLLSYIQERLGELEEEKEELRAYHDKDRERRCLEYTIYHREQEEINATLEQLENMRETGIDMSNENRSRFQDLDQEKSQFETVIKELRQRASLLLLDKKQYEDERRDLSRKLAEADFEVNSIQAGQQSAAESRQHQAQEQQQLSKAIQEREGQLGQLGPQYEQAKQQEKSLKSQLVDAEGKRSRLFAKQGRNSRFKSKAERDKWLQKEISDTEMALATKKAVAMQTNEELVQVQQQIDQVTSEISDLRQQILNRGENMQGLHAEIQSAKDARDKLLDKRKELWREEARLGSSINNTRQEYDRAERVLSSSTDHNTSRGIAAIRRIKEQHGLHGVYGTLAELFKVSNKFKTAVEVTAGGSLFHIVVDNDETASTVLEILTKEKAGRVTFMPLNRLKPRNVNLPKANDAIPMMEKLDFDPKYTKAFQQVFGRTIVCPNLEIGSHYARTHGISAVTPEGDRSDNKGALTGGYHDPRSSSIDAIQDLARWRAELDKQRTTLDEIRHGIEVKDQEVTKAVGELQRLEQRRSQAEGSYEPLQRDIRAKTIDLQGRQDALEQKRRNKENIDASTSDLSEQQEGYEAELQTEFKKELSTAEEAELEELQSAMPALRKKHMNASSQRAELEAQKSGIELELRENLRPRQDQLNGQALQGDSTNSEGALAARQKDLKRVTKALHAVEKQLLSTETSMGEVAAELTENEQAHSAKMQELEELARDIEKTQKRMEKSMGKKSLLMEKAAEASRNIRELGVLPDEAFEKYTSYSSDKAIKRLHRVNDDLKKYSHVNKKAFEQYTNFTRQREQLLKRRTELDTSQQSIRDLIDVLDQRKDEAIERTFKQVSKEFASIFQRLVPAGKGRLVIQRKSDGATGDDSDSEQEERNRSGSVENYTGVSIQVSFNSKHDEQQRIQQLSGGQKSLCALALVFAIQMCDPAPFYLFDEIDANLDAQYRTAVADLLQQISQNGQFICTTFRPEMVHVAEKCYGVTFSGNKTSRIDVVDRDAALGFVEGQISGA